MLMMDPPLPYNRNCRIMGGLGVGLLLTVAGFKVVVPEDPYAMLSDTYLETLKKDDDIANEAAKKVRGVSYLPCCAAHQAYMSPEWDG